MSKEIGRRDFLKVLGMSAGALCLDWTKAAAAQASDTELVYVLKGGNCYIDGSLRVSDVGIKSDGRLLLGSNLVGKETIDVSGKIVSPGFIDILADNSSNPATTYYTFEKYKLGDGVTTALQMHGGATHAGEFYKTFASKPHLTNYGVSTKVMNLRYGKYNLAERCRLIESSLDAGSLGVSHSPEYQPNTTWEELVEYAKIAAKYDRPLFLHTRYSSKERELEGVDEAIKLAQQCGCRVHIDHLNSTGGTFHMDEALERIRNARNSGLQITTCVYPHSYWATYISSARFNPGWQERYGMTYSDLEIVGTGERLTETTFKQYRSKTGVLVAAKPGVQPLETTVLPALKEDFCVIGSDGGIERDKNANNHPRGANCFATAIRYALDNGITLENILDKMTARSAQIIGFPMRERGVLRDGYVADITVFDSKTIRGVATNANPNQFSDGILMCFVGGKLAFQDKRIAGVNAGQAIKF